METAAPDFANTEESHSDHRPATDPPPPAEDKADKVETYHDGRDASGRPATSPPLTGDQMDEVGW